MRHPAFPNLLPFAAAALLLIAAGCNRDGVKVYKVDSSDVVATTAPPVVVAPPSGMPATMPDGLAAPDNSGLPKLKYTLPGGWKEKAPSQMRVASFDISDHGKTVDVSVIPLGPMSGTDTANVNRWRGQVGQPPLDDATLKQTAEPVQVGEKAAYMYDITGTSPGSSDEERIIGVIFHTDDATWYFKMMGDSALAEKNKPAFIAFLSMVEFQSSTGAMPPMDMSQLPAGHPAISGVALESQIPAGDKPSWTVPSGWKAGELTQFLVAKYVIQGKGDASAAVNISQLDGDGGGLLPNINRWRGQLGQPPITDDDAAKLPTVDASGAKAVVTDFTGTDMRNGGKSARLVGVLLPLDGQTWFYKLMGDPDIVSQQKDAFVAFIQSAKYPAAK
jgi:hypothetical protein